MDQGWRWSTVDYKQSLSSGSPEDGQNGTPVRGTSLQLRKKGEGTAVILTGYRRERRRGERDQAMVVKEQWRKCSVRVALGHGEKRIGVGRGALEGGEALPLYRGRGGGGG
jgi:hypothetical protein